MQAGTREVRSTAALPRPAKISGVSVAGVRTVMSKKQREKRAILKRFIAAQPATRTVSAGPEFIFNTLEVERPREPLHEFLGAASGAGIHRLAGRNGTASMKRFTSTSCGPECRRSGSARNSRESSAISPGGRMSASASRRTRSAPAAVGFECAVSDFLARAAQGNSPRAGRSGCGGIGRALADQEGEVRDGTTARGPGGRQAGRGVPTSSVRTGRPGLRSCGCGSGGRGCGLK